MVADNRILAYLLLSQSPPESVAESKLGALVADVVNAQLASVAKRISTDLDIRWTANDASEYLKEAEALVKAHPEDQESLLILAVTCLQLYIQSNITGPNVAISDIDCLIPSSDASKLQEFTDACTELLGKDGEPAFSLMSHSYLLVLALTMLSELHSPYAKWWLARAQLIQQSVINSPSATLHDSINSILTESVLSEVSADVEDSIKRELRTRFYCECARSRIVYGNEAASDKFIQLAVENSRFQSVLTGVKAKRTKFQQHETSQLLYLAKSSDSANAPAPESSLPNTFDLNSDLLLEKPTYSEIDISAESELPEELKNMDLNKPMALLDIDSAIVLLKMAAIRGSTPHKDALIQEELQAMVSRIINSPQSSVNWSIFSMALWTRSILESDSAKTVERGVLQMQSLVEELGHSQASYIPKEEAAQSAENVAKRLEYIHQLMPLPKWAMDTKLAEKFMSIGALKSSIDVYERLHMWGEVALCYAAVGQQQQGVALLKTHLEKHPKDARAISILGDITMDPKMWEKAWEVGKYPAAKRSLGQFYYSPPPNSGVARNIDLAISHLHDSLKINPLNNDAWFIYGCAGLETRQFELAAEAFTRCIAIDEDDPKSWSNLATALLHLNKKQEAFNALKRASRTAHNKQDWRIWSNYTAVAADLGLWTEVLRGLKSVISLRSEKEGEKCIDIEYLEKLLEVLVQEQYDGATASHFQKTAIDLFVNVVAPLITANPRLWKLLARVHIWSRVPWAALEDYEKGFRIFTHTPLLESDEEVWDEAVEFCGDLVDAYINFGPLEGKFGEGSLVCKDWKFKARSCVRLLMGRGKAFWEDSKGWDRLQALKEELTS